MLWCHGVCMYISELHVAAAGAELYQEVKRASDSFFGIPSQCFVSSNAGINNPGKMRGRPQYCANVALKVRDLFQIKEVQPSQSARCG